MSIASGLSFDGVERLVSAYSPQLSDTGLGIIRIPILTVQKILSWAPFTAQWVAEHDPTTGKTLLGVLLLHDRERPAARYYFSEIPHGGLNVLRKHLPTLQEVRSTREFELLAATDTFAARLQEYRRQQSTPRGDLLNQFFEGRIKSTITEGVHYLDMGGTCLLCNAPATGSVLTTTIATSNGTQTIAISLCPEHEHKSSTTFLLDYLAKEMDVVIPLHIAEADPENIYTLIERSLLELDCDNLRRDKVKIQVTGTRASGVNVILRCELLTQKRSYAYMIVTPANVNIRRVDNAADHPEQTFRWDHQHLGLPKDNSSVAPSFTTGWANLDLPTIRNEIHAAEASMHRRSPPGPS